MSEEVSNVPECFIRLTLMSKRARLFVRTSAIISVEQREATPTDPAGVLVRLSGTDYFHLVRETPEEIFAQIGAAGR